LSRRKEEVGGGSNRTFAPYRHVWITSATGHRRRGKGLTYYYLRRDFEILQTELLSGPNGCCSKRFHKVRMGRKFSSSPRGKSETRISTLQQRAKRNFSGLFQAEANSFFRTEEPARPPPAKVPYFRTCEGNKFNKFKCARTPKLSRRDRQK